MTKLSKFSESKKPQEQLEQDTWYFLHYKWFWPLKQINLYVLRNIFAILENNKGDSPNKYLGHHLSVSSSFWLDSPVPNCLPRSFNLTVSSLFFSVRNCTLCCHLVYTVLSQGAFTPGPGFSLFRHRRFILNHSAKFPLACFVFHCYVTALCVLVELCIVGWRHDNE